MCNLAYPWYTNDSDAQATLVKTQHLLNQGSEGMMFIPVGVEDCQKHSVWNNTERHQQLDDLHKCVIITHVHGILNL